MIEQPTSLPCPGGERSGTEGVAAPVRGAPCPQDRPEGRGTQPVARAARWGDFFFSLFISQNYILNILCGQSC